MRLVDLDPRWVMRGPERIGFTFISPVQTKRSDGTYSSNPWRQSCFVVALGYGAQHDLISMVEPLGDDALVQLCSNSARWVVKDGIEKANFENLTVTPSIDGSAGKMWHGYITDGEIVGGI